LELDLIHDRDLGRAQADGEGAALEKLLERRPALRRDDL
jgi:hypothetical protein